jgi:hypothetical protein
MRWRQPPRTPAGTLGARNTVLTGQVDEADRAGEKGRNHASAKKVRCLTVTPGRAGSTALADLPEPGPAPEMLLVQAIAIVPPLGAWIVRGKHTGDNPPTGRLGNCR